VLQNGFDPTAVWDALTIHKCTHVSFVPTMLYRLLKAYDESEFPESLRLILLGGAAASDILLDSAVKRGLPVAPTYGLTEATSQVATILPDEARRKRGSVGKPLPHVSVRIVDEQGNDLPNGKYGEIVVRGKTIMRGYLDQPDLNGELHTGDIGYFDGDGDLWLVQRRSDLIISGGENIYPVEIENVLRGHPNIEDVCVIGVPDAEWGQSVAAAIALRIGETLTENELITWARERLAGYKVPRSIKFVEALPMTASGKLERKSVRAMFDIR
jgi:O-succinylbenzoic acid--CoA ligase